MKTLPTPLPIAVVQALIESPVGRYASKAGLLARPFAFPLRARRARQVRR
jgi:hypothetical protein